MLQEAEGFITRRLKDVSPVQCQQSLLEIWRAWQSWDSLRTEGGFDSRLPMQEGSLERTVINRALHPRSPEPNQSGSCRADTRNDCLTRRGLAWERFTQLGWGVCRWKSLGAG